MNNGSIIPAVDAAMNLARGWSETLSGRSDFSEPLNFLCALTNAQSAILVRHRYKESATRIICSHTVDEMSRRIPQSSLALTILGAQHASARDGSVWTLSETHRFLEISNEIQLNERAGMGRISDVALIVLNIGQTRGDFLELYLGAQLAPRRQQILNTIAPPLAQMWADRKQGIIRSKMLRHRQHEKILRTGWSGLGILAPENPTGLSRAEYRVCSMLCQGFTAKAIASELAIKESTVRTHLRHIYAKTETHGQVELLHLLHAQQGAA